MTSTNFVRAATRQETDEVVVALLTIEHPNMDPPARVCSDAVDITSNGNVFKGGVPFTCALPDAHPDKRTAVRLLMDILDQELIAHLRSIPAGVPATVTLELVLAATPDIIESGPYVFTLRSADWDIQDVEAEIAFEDVLGVKVPGERFIPSTHPGLF